jgi:hypothetical protein
MSLGKMNSAGAALGSPDKPYDANGYGDTEATIYSTNYSKKTHDSM